MSEVWPRDEMPGAAGPVGTFACVVCLQVDVASARKDYRAFSGISAIFRRCFWRPIFSGFLAWMAMDFIPQFQERDLRLMFVRGQSRPIDIPRLLPGCFSPILQHSLLQRHTRGWPAPPPKNHLLRPCG